MAGPMPATIDARELATVPAATVEEMVWNHTVAWWRAGGRELGEDDSFDDYYLAVRASYGALAERQLWLGLLAGQLLRLLLASGQLPLARDLSDSEVRSLLGLLRAGLFEVGATAMTNLRDVQTDDKLADRPLPIGRPALPA